MPSRRTLLAAGLALLLAGATTGVLFVLQDKSNQISDLRQERDILRDRNAELAAGVSESRRSVRIANARLATVRGKLDRLSSARLKPGEYGNVYTGRFGDTFRVPAAAAECTASGEGGVPNLYCTHYPSVRYQVYFYSDRLLVWRNGNPDSPVFSELP